MTKARLAACLTGAALLGAAAAGTGIAAASTSTPRPGPASEYVIRYHGQTFDVIEQRTRTGANTFDLRVSVNGKRYTLICASETARLAYCGAH